MRNKILLAGQSDIAMPGCDGEIYEYRGFRVARHNSDRGSVIEYKAANGSIKHILVADVSAMLAGGRWGFKSTSFPELEKFGMKNKSGNQYICGSLLSPKVNEDMPEAYTNDAIFELWGSVYASDRTAAEYTEIYISKAPGDALGANAINIINPIASSYKFAGVPCTIPTIYQGLVVFCCFDMLDLLSPEKINTGAISDCRKFKNYKGAANVNVGTLTIKNDTAFIAINGQGIVGGIEPSYNGGSHIVVPILELD